MPDFALQERSGLEQLARPGRYGVLEGDAGVTMALRTGVAMASLLVRRGAQDALARAVRERFGVDLPLQARRTEGGGVAFVWAGPGQWLALVDATDGITLTRRLEDAVGESASVVDQSDGRVLLRVGGPRIRDAMSKLVGIDLHQRAFAEGDVALTSVAYMSVQFWQRDAAPTYECVVFRSYAADFWRTVANGAAEFGAVTLT